MSKFLFAAALAAATAFTPQAFAHGFAGNRFFPATIATEDPAVADELSLPTARWRDGESEYALDFSKTLTPRLGVSLGEAWVDGADGDGFDNLETGIKYQFVTDAAHETLMSVGLEVEWGGSGAARVGAESVTTLAPSLYFGHGFGAASADWAKPFAITGSISAVIPARGRDDAGDTIPYAMEYGFALEYSLPYLAAHVRDRGWPDWVNQLTPLVEIAIEQPVRNSGGEGVTGTINPGLLWSGHRLQLGAEAIIPINDASGDGVGFALQAHFFIDDIFSRSFGRPVFGRST